MSDHQADYPIATMCRVLGVSSSGYHAWVKRRPSQRAETDAVLIAAIRAAHTASRGTYGAPRIHAELAAKGIRVGCKRVARLMTQAGLAGVCRRRFVTTTVKDGGSRAPDLVERNFTAAAPDRLGSPTSPTFRPGQAFSISRSCSTSSVAVLSAGRWPRHSPDNWCSMP